MKIYINGRFFGRPTTGVERFGRMIVESIDNLKDALFPAVEFVLFVPTNTALDSSYRRITVRECGKSRGHFWEQIELPYFSRDGKLLNLCNSGPLLHRDQLTVVHDALVYRMPGNFSPTYGAFHRVLGRGLAHRSRLATVSDFSKHELSTVLNVPSEHIVRVSNGADHYANISPDPSILNRLNLTKLRYFMFVGSPARNKNLDALVSAFERLNLGGVQLVTVGALAKTFSDGRVAAGKNVVHAGRVTDQELHALYEGAIALVFPSIYEGFGIPLLEAMFVGCPVLASNIPSAREVCRNAAQFFEPTDINSISEAMRLATLQSSADRSRFIKLGKSRAASYSWKTSARILVESVLC